MKKLLLLTDGFPYGMSEPFLFPEIAILKDFFEISIISIDTNSKISSDYHWDFPISRINVDLHLTDVFRYGACILTNKMFWQDLHKIITTRKLLFKRIVYSFAVLMKAEKFRRQVKKKHVLSNYDLIYSYWHDYKVLAFGMLLLKQGASNIPVVARTHGYDLFNERRSVGQRQPYLPYMDKYLSTLLFVSKMGFQYYRDTFNFVENCAYEVAYLGVAPTYHTSAIDEQYGLSLLSVANAIPLKRIELIIQALAGVAGFSVKWVHIGGGQELASLQSYAEKILSPNPLVDYTFIGHVSSSEILQYYRHNCIDVFISTSASEGCPVSMQEAFAFGVPVVSTNVGGVSEIVEDGSNGILLNPNPSINDIQLALEQVVTLKKANQLQNFKSKAIRTWQQKFDATKNFKALAGRFQTIIADNS